MTLKRRLEALTTALEDREAASACPGCARDLRSVAILVPGAPPPAQCPACAPTRHVVELVFVPPTTRAA